MKPTRPAKITRASRQKYFEQKSANMKKAKIRQSGKQQDPAKPQYDFTLLEVTNLKMYAPLSKTRKFDALWQALSDQEEDKLRLAFTRALAQELVAEVKQAVRLQRFKVVYQPLSAKYAARKRKLKRKEGFWQNTGYLIENLTMWKVPNENIYKVGYPKAKLHPSSGTPLSHIMYILERGSEKRNIPARPLFTPIMDGIMRDVSPKFFNFLKTYERGKYLPLVN